ncbi:MAG: radical SAM protein [bacterium]
MKRFNYARPPLGLAYLAANVGRENAENVGVEIVDCMAEGLGADELLSALVAKKPWMAGFLVVTATAATFREISRSLKKASPETFILAGGPHATVLPADRVFEWADAVVVGEGETTFSEIIGARLSGSGVENIPGVHASDKSGGGPWKPRRLIENLDSLEPPGRQYLKNGKYYHSFPYRTGRGSIFTTLFTTRGCPHSCCFCANEVLWGRRLREFSVPYVMNEFELVERKFGAGLVFIDDDDFTFNRGRMREICEAKLGAGLGFKWICHARVEDLHPEAFPLMKRAGCVEMQLGIESGVEEIRRTIPKKFSSAEGIEKIRVAKRHGINVWATFIIGHESDTPETVRKTIEYSVAANPTYASFILMLPLPGTRVFESFKSKGYLKTTNWADYSWHSDPVFELPGLPSERVVALRSEAYRRFFIRTRKLLELFFFTIKAGRLDEMGRNFLSWFSLVFKE